MAKGRYVAFPLRIGHGMAATCGREDHVRQMIEQVLFTMPGERVMHPEFGTGITRLLFDTTTSDAVSVAQSLVSAQLQRFLGDIISVRDVDVTVEESKLSVNVVYELLETRQIRQERFER